MAYVHPDKTGRYFEGLRFVVCAHYGRIVDYREERHDTREGAEKAAKLHAERGANVLVYATHWREHFSHWAHYPATT